MSNRASRSEQESPEQSPPEPFKMLECVDCNEEFPLPQSEENFFKDKGLSLPKRCKPCRKIKRERNAANGT